MSDERTGEAIVLDVLAHGRSDDDRPRYRREPVAYVLGVDDFQLYELAFDDAPPYSIGERVPLDPDDADVAPARHNRVDFEGLSQGARSEVDYAVEEVVDEDEARFVTFFNESQPISLRLHQLNLLPGIGDKLRDDILDERKRAPFESVEELEERISGLHGPREIVVERVMEELRDDDVKYRLFVRTDRPEE